MRVSMCMEWHTGSDRESAAPLLTRAKSTHFRRSQLDYGLFLQAKVLNSFEVVAFSLGVRGPG